MNRKKIIPALAVACLSFAVTTAAVTAGESKQLATDANGQPRTPGVDAAQARFGVLRRDQHASDAMADKVTGPFGSNLDLARRVSTTSGDVRVVPGNDTLCLRAEDAVGSAWSCAPTAAAEEGRLVLTLRDAGGGPSRVFGLVPDGVKTVGLTSAGGESQVTVRDNVYAATAVDPQRARFDAGDGVREVVVP